jgi:predicted outer membrane protein
MLDNAEEVALGKLAEQRSQNPQVKQFAQQMVQDHSQMLEKLQQFVSGRSTDPSQPGQTSSSISSQQGTSSTQQHTRQQDAGLLAAKTDAAKRCLQMKQQELSQKQGAEFDKCYVGSQLLAHMGMLATLEAFQKHASPQLQQQIAQGIQTTQQHLTHARQLAQQLEGQQSATAGQSTPSPTETRSASRENVPTGADRIRSESTDPGTSQGSIESSDQGAPGSRSGSSGTGQESPGGSGSSSPGGGQGGSGSTGGAGSAGSGQGGSQ